MDNLDLTLLSNKKGFTQTFYVKFYRDDYEYYLEIPITYSFKGELLISLDNSVSEIN